jgi:hypothetical protein
MEAKGASAQDDLAEHNGSSRIVMFWGGGGWGGGCGGFAIIPIPREATSVATMMGLLPVLKSFKTQSRSFCCLSPWMAWGMLVYGLGGCSGVRTYIEQAIRPVAGTE